MAGVDVSIGQAGGLPYPRMLYAPSQSYPPNSMIQPPFGIPNYDR